MAESLWQVFHGLTTLERRVSLGRRDLHMARTRVHKRKGKQVESYHSTRAVYECPSDNTKFRKQEDTDAFGIPFHTDINDDYRGVNDNDASYYIFCRFLLSDGRP
jgi:hypothetical protein